MSETQPETSDEPAESGGLEEEQNATGPRMTSPDEGERDEALESA